jgi:para-nitrobenzyl esterase
VYRFDYSRDQSGANHAGELGYVWFTGKNNSFNTEEVILAKQMHQAWVNFIKGRKPGEINHAQWPLYTSGTREVQIFDRVSHPEKPKTIFNDPKYPSSSFVVN